MNCLFSPIPLALQPFPNVSEQTRLDARRTGHTDAHVRLPSKIQKQTLSESQTGIATGENIYFEYTVEIIGYQ